MPYEIFTMVCGVVMVMKDHYVIFIWTGSSGSLRLTDVTNSVLGILVIFVGR